MATPVMDNSVQMLVRVPWKGMGGYCRGNINSVAQALEHCQCKILHRKRSTVRYGNALFSYLAVDSYDTHGKYAYPQAVKHPIFMLEHKHTVRREAMVYQTATQQPLVTPVLFQESRSCL